MFLFADFYAQFAVVLFLLPSWLSSIYSDFEFGNNTEGNARITITIWGLAISIAWFIFRELIQLYSSTIKQYARGIGNYMDAAQIILLVMAVQVLNDINDGNGGDVSAYYSRTERRVVFILSSLFSWLLLLRVFSRLFYDVSVFVYAVTQVRSSLSIDFIFATSARTFLYIHYVSKCFPFCT